MATTGELARATDPQWAGRLVEHLDELLLEQAHLEKKAAAAAMALLFRYPDRPALQQPLSRLAREELRHFERVIQVLEQRGRDFGPQIPGPYAGRLKRVVRLGEPHRLLDELLVCAVIEARSCERMALLAEAAAERNPELSDLYRELVASEARHRELYIELALELFAEPEVSRRWTEIARHEAEVLEEIPQAPRLHSA